MRERLDRNTIIGLLTDTPITYYPTIAKQFKSVTAAVLLSNLLRWHGKGSDPDGWIHKTIEVMTEETGLSRREQETAINTLMAAGVLSYKVAGHPAKRYFLVLLDPLMDLLGKDAPEVKKQTTTQTIPEEYTAVLQHWNSKGIITHQEKYNKAKLNLLKKAIKTYGQDGVCEAIDNYSMVLQNPADYFFTYKWTLYEFVTKGIGKFAGDNYNQYRKTTLPGGKNVTSSKREAESAAADEAIRRAEHFFPD